MEELGQGFLELLKLGRKAISPESLGLLEDLTEIPSRMHRTEVKGVGLFGLLWTFRDPRVKKALGLVLELTRALGEGEMTKQEKAPA